MTKKDLAQKRVSRIGGLTDSYTANLNSVADQFEKKLNDLLSQNKVMQSIDVAAARAQVTTLLTDSGYYEVVNNLLSKGYQDLIDGTLEDYKAYFGKTLAFNPVSLERLNKIREAKFLDWENIAQDQVTTFQRIMMNVSFGTQTAEQASAAIASEIEEGMKRYASTWVETALAGWEREESNTLAMDAGIEYYEYIGPDDDITREFCQEHLGEVKTIDEWNSLDNGQIGPVSEYCGGHNCRHSLIPVLSKGGNE